MRLIADFKRMQSITPDLPTVIQALRDCPEVELSPDGSRLRKVRRVIRRALDGWLRVCLFVRPFLVLPFKFFLVAPALLGGGENHIGKGATPTFSSPPPRLARQANPAHIFSPQHMAQAGCGRSAVVCAVVLYIPVSSKCGALPTDLSSKPCFHTFGYSNKFGSLIWRRFLPPHRRPSCGGGGQGVFGAWLEKSKRGGSPLLPPPTPTPFHFWHQR